MKKSVRPFTILAIAAGILLAATPAVTTATTPGSADQLWTVQLAGANGDRRGYAVAERGDLLILGNPASDGVGSAWILERDRRGGFSDPLPLVATEPVPGDRFGAAVAVDGELALVGAPGRGAAIVFRYERVREAWLQEALLVGDPGVAGVDFGYSVSLHGQQAVVGAPGADGAVYHFRRDPGTRQWQFGQRIAPAAGGSGSAFGTSVALAGDLLLVGAPQDRETGAASGSVRAFRRDPASDRWQEEARLLARDAGDGDRFGHSVALQGRTAVIGAPANAAGARRPGAAYVFDRDPLSASWRQNAVLAAADPALGLGLGTRVALRGDRVLVQAANATSTHLFRRQPGGYWAEEAELAGGAGRDKRAPSATTALSLSSTDWLGAHPISLGTFALAPAPEATCVWTGAVNGNWETAGNWSCGAVPGAGDDVTIAIAGNVTVNSAVTVHDLTLSGSVGALTISGPVGSMTTTGTFNWAAGQINIQNITTWTNQNVFDIQANFLQMFPGGADFNTLINNGTLRKSAGDQFANIHVNFQNSGTVDAQSGQLSITGGGTATYTGSTLTASAGAGLFLSGSKIHTFAGTAIGNPAGVVELAGGSMRAAAGGATLNLGGQGFRWGAGSYNGANVLTNAGRLRLVAGSAHQIDATTLINGATGTLEWTADNFQFCNAATLNNQGIFDVQLDSATVIDCGAGPNTVVNSGTVKKSVGSGGSNIGIAVQSTGTLSAESGTLSLGAGSTLSNSILTASTGAVLSLGGGTHVVSGTLTGNPAGTVQFAGSALRAAAGGGTINLGGEGFQWTSGTVSGANLLSNAGRFRFVGSNHQVDAATLTNAAGGTMEWAANNIQLCNAATLENQGSLDIQADNLQMNDCGGGPNRLSNSGTLRKSAGSAGSIVFVQFDNLAGGILEVGGAAGSSLSFTNSFNHAAGAILRGNRSVGVPGSMVNAGITAPGTSPGQLTVAGNWNPTASAVLRVEMQGLTPVTQHDQLAVQGTATLGGTIEVSFLAGYVPVVGNSFVVLTCTTACNGTFAGVNSPAGTHFDVVYNPTNVTLVVSGPGIFANGFE